MGVKRVQEELLQMHRLRQQVVVVVARVVVVAVAVVRRVMVVISQGQPQALVAQVYQVLLQMVRQISPMAVVVQAHLGQQLQQEQLGQQIVARVHRVAVVQQQAKAKVQPAALVSSSSNTAAMHKKIHPTIL